MGNKKTFTPRYGRFTEIILSTGCLTLFTLGGLVLVWFPLLLWQGLLASKSIFLSLGLGVLQLFLWPAGFRLMRYSLLLLHRVEINSGLWKPFAKRVKKIRRRQMKRPDILPQSEDEYPEEEKAVQ